VLPFLNGQSGEKSWSAQVEQGQQELAAADHRLASSLSSSS
jgi:hypothetical protein